VKDSINSHFGRKSISPYFNHPRWHYKVEQNLQLPAPIVTDPLGSSLSMPNHEHVICQTLVEKRALQPVFSSPGQGGMISQAA